VAFTNVTNALRKVRIAGVSAFSTASFALAVALAASTSLRMFTSD
jgi:hypothetical protein